MNRNVSHGIARFRCMTRIYSPEKCRCPSIREAALESAILKAIQEQIQELVDVKTVIDKARRAKADSCAANEYLIALNRTERERKRLEDTDHIHIYFKFSPEREKLLNLARNVEEEKRSAAVSTL